MRRTGGVLDEERSWSAGQAEAFQPAVPWRTFRWFYGQKHYSGTYWSSTMSDHVIYESRLELTRLLYADFDHRVRAVYAQPFLMKTKIDGRMRRHVPDFLLLREGDVPLVVDVKPRKLLPRPKVRFSLGWARDVVESRRCRDRREQDHHHPVGERVRHPSSQPRRGEPRQGPQGHPGRPSRPAHPQAGHRHPGRRPSARPLCRRSPLPLDPISSTRRRPALAWSNRSTGLNATSGHSSSTEHRGTAP
ncbi:TnsA-like heteromeric transposase endonuclease subunit [Streptomyces sp. NPDC018587]|uniref:TnsA-like heteromeric transposase endonuclease subunit n=1 Tax=unclassified Streptomyces TaxID=2593676 RepID=UPI00379EA4A7